MFEFTTSFFRQAWPLSPKMNPETLITVISLLLITTSFLTGFAKPDNEDDYKRIEDFINEVMDVHNIPGMAVAVVKASHG